MGWKDSNLKELLKERTTSIINKPNDVNFERCECDNCSGTGMVQISPDAKGLEVCPICLGNGQVIKLYDKENK